MAVEIKQPRSDKEIMDEFPVGLLLERAKIMVKLNVRNIRGAVTLCTCAVSDNVRFVESLDGTVEWPKTPFECILCKNIKTQGILGSLDYDMAYFFLLCNDCKQEIKMSDSVNDLGKAIANLLKGKELSSSEINVIIEELELDFDKD